MRVILYTGKGGVGKTSAAAATAVRAAALGHRTVVMSTDAAHSLAEPVPVAPNLWGQEIDVLRELDRHWKTVQEWLAALMRWQGLDEVVAEELAILPGMEELVALLYVTRYHRQGDFDTLVVDCAPTGETLRLLSFPEMARWYMHRLFPPGRMLAGAVAPIARGLMRIPIPGAQVFDSIQELYNQLEEMRSVLQDGSSASVRLVVNPEKMVIKEAQRTFTYLNLYGYSTDLVVCNRVLPQEVGDAYFDAWKEAQARYVRLVEETFSPLPILKVPLLQHEVVGLAALEELATAMFDGRDPTAVFYEGQSQELTRQGQRYVMRVRLPFVTRERLAVTELGDEVVVRVGSYRRNLLLPRVLMGYAVEDARLEGDVLVLTFAPARPAADGASGP